jgi:hypothetical protein
MNPGAELHVEWAFKRSFLEYVSRLPDGRCQLSGGTTVGPNGAFRFPATTLPGFVASVGAVRFIGHGGALDLQIAAPGFALSAEGAHVSIETDAGALVVATSPEVVAFEVGSVLRGLVLTEAGREVFGGFYESGTPLEPISLVA